MSPAPACPPSVRSARTKQDGTTVWAHTKPRKSRNGPSPPSRLSVSVREESHVSKELHDHFTPSRRRQTPPASDGRLAPPASNGMAYPFPPCWLRKAKTTTNWKPCAAQYPFPAE